MRACAELKLKTKPNIDYIDNVILNEYTSYSAMRALECFITQKIHSEGEKGEIFPITSPDWHSKSKRLGSGTYGTANLTTIFEKSAIVIKTIKKEHEDMAKTEYDFCANVINNLRYYCPNYCYTLGAFSNSKGQNICFEYAGKYTISDFFSTGKYNFKTFFPVLIQLLAALEIGQRECRFAHYDLGWSNVAIRDTKTSFGVNIGSKTIEFNDVFCPVIIDFGMASAVSSSGKKYSVFEKSLDEGDYGKYSFLLQGFDMFFLLADLYCYIYQGEIRDFLINLLFEIYEITPYDFNYINNRGPDHWGEISKSTHIAYTPGALMFKLLEKYPQYMKGHIKVKERDTFEINSLDTLSSIFENISNSSIHYVKDCLDSCDSYIMYTYYTDKEPPSKYMMLERDRKLLVSARDFKIDLSLAEESKAFLRGATLRKGVDATGFMERTESILTLLTYANIYYMIKEMKLDIPFYKEFASFFENSGLYRYFAENSDVIIYARRWALSLIEYGEI